MTQENLPLKDGQYFTIKEAIDHEITIKRSRFITSLRFVRERADFDAHLKEISALYPKANHYCWAYRFNSKIVLEHSSDAGEPAGTAGRPILGSLKKYSLLNIMAVVTRYFGGIKLGVKGLIDAYSSSVLEAIEHSRITIEEPRSLLSFNISYDLYNIFLARMKNCSIQVEDIKADFSEVISGEIIFNNSDADIIQKALLELDTGSDNFKYTITPAEDRS